MAAGPVEEEVSDEDDDSRDAKDPDEASDWAAPEPRELETSISKVPATYQVNQLGRWFGSSKLRHVWTLSLDESKVMVELEHSRMTGKKKVLIDGKVVYSTREKKLTWSWVHPASLAKISLTSENGKHELECEEPEKRHSQGESEGTEPEALAAPDESPGVVRPPSTKPRRRRRGSGSPRERQGSARPRPRGTRSSRSASRKRGTSSSPPPAERPSTGPEPWLEDTMAAGGARGRHREDTELPSACAELQNTVPVPLELNGAPVPLDPSEVERLDQAAKVEHARLHALLGMKDAQIAVLQGELRRIGLDADGTLSGSAPSAPTEKALPKPVPALPEGPRLAQAATPEIVLAPPRLAGAPLQAAQVPAVRPAVHQAAPIPVKVERVVVGAQGRAGSMPPLTPRDQDAPARVLAAPQQAFGQFVQWTGWRQTGPNTYVSESRSATPARRAATPDPRGIRTPSVPPPVVQMAPARYVQQPPQRVYPTAATPAFSPTALMASASWSPPSVLAGGPQVQQMPALPGPRPLLSPGPGSGLYIPQSQPSATSGGRVLLPPPRPGGPLTPLPAAAAVGSLLAWTPASGAQLPTPPMELAGPIPGSAPKEEKKTEPAPSEEEPQGVFGFFQSFSLWST